MTSPIDLTKLPPPDVVEALDFETLYTQGKAILLGLWPSFNADLESEPANKVMQVVAYIALGLRQRVNDAVRAVLLATSKGNDLDNLGALLGVKRLTITPANPDQGVIAVMEQDDDYRYRITLAPSGFSVAGPEAAYIFHALSASGDVLDASATSPDPDDIKALVASILAAHNAAADLVNDMQAALDAARWPGDVLVAVLSRQGNGAAPQTLLDTVASYVSADDIRPMTDNVSVQSADIVEFEIDADLWSFAGPDPDVAMANAKTNAQAYVDQARRLGRDITLSSIYAALSVAGIQNVQLNKPTGNIAISDTQAPYCTAINLAYRGIGD